MKCVQAHTHIKNLLPLCSVGRRNASTTTSLLRPGTALTARTATSSGKTRSQTVTSEGRTGSWTVTQDGKTGSQSVRSNVRTRVMVEGSSGVLHRRQRRIGKVARADRSRGVLPQTTTRTRSRAASLAAQGLQQSARASTGQAVAGRRRCCNMHVLVAKTCNHCCFFLGPYRVWLDCLMDGCVRLCFCM